MWSGFEGQRGGGGAGLCWLELEYNKFNGKDLSLEEVTAVAGGEGLAGGRLWPQGTPYLLRQVRVLEVGLAAVYQDRPFFTKVHRSYMGHPLSTATFSPTYTLRK